jgi:hypothetical protein
MKTAQRLTGLFAFGGIVLAAGVAYATVAFDASTGAGFVGKGDVQLAFGWNNAQLQANASGVSFSYLATDNYSAVCEWITGEGTKSQRTHDVTHTATTSVNGQVAYDARTHQQIDGFNLTGYGTTTETGEVPVVGGACPGSAGTDGAWISAELTSSTADLFVSFDTASVQLSPSATP